MDIDISRIGRKTIAIHLKIESYHKMQPANFRKYLNMSRDGNCVRDEYIKLKNRNRDTNKKSFILYLESIHNVYNHIQQRLEDEEDNLPRGLTYLNPW